MAVDSDIRVFVEEAANIINLPAGKQKQILKRLEEECISKQWQLKSISNEQWEAMGAPIGFVITLKNCLDKRQLEELKVEPIDEANKAMSSSSAEPQEISKRNRRGRDGKSRRSLSKSKLDSEANEQQQQQQRSSALVQDNNISQDWIFASIVKTNPKQITGLHLHHDEDGAIRIEKVDGVFEITDVQPGDRLLEFNQQDVSSFQGGLPQIQQLINESPKVQVKVLRSSTRVVKADTEASDILEVNAGDTVMVSGSGDNDLDGQLVALKRKSSKQGRWLAQVQGSGKMAIVDNKHLSDKDGNPIPRKIISLNDQIEKEGNPVALKEELHQELQRDIDDMMASDQPAVRKRRKGLGRRSRSSSRGSLDDDKSTNERRVSKSPESRRAVIGHDVSDKELAMRGQTPDNNAGSRRRRLSSSSGGSLRDLNVDDKHGRRRRLSSSSGGSLRDLNVDDKNDGSGLRRRLRSSSSGSLRDLNVDDNYIHIRARVSKSPESRRAVIGHDVSNKELGSSERPRRRRLSSSSVNSLRDLSPDDKNIRARVSKSPESRRAVIGHDVSNKELGSSERPRRRRLSSSSVNSLKDLRADDPDARLRVSKSPESRRAVIGHDVSNKELAIKGEHLTSPVPRRRKVRSLDDDIDDDQNLTSPQRRSSSLGPMAKVVDPSESLRNLGDLADSKNDSDHPLSLVSPRKRRSTKAGNRRISKSPDKLRAIIGHNVSDTELNAKESSRLSRRQSRDRSRSKSREKNRNKKLDAVERSRLSREQSRRRLTKSNSSSHIVPLKSGDESSLSTSRRRGPSDDESSIGSSSRRRHLKGSSDDEHSIGDSLRRRLKTASDHDGNSISSSSRRRAHDSSDGEGSVNSRPRLARRSTSNRSIGARKTQRSKVLAPPPQIPGRLVKTASLAENDSTMKSRRLERAKRRGSVGGRPQSPDRSFARCRSESPAATRALLHERNDVKPRNKRSTGQSGPAQFQPSLDHAIQCNYSSNALHSDDASVVSFASIQSTRSLEHSSKVEKNSQSGRFCYVSRGKTIYEWNQDFDTMVLLVPKPPEVSVDDVFCTIEELSLQLGQIKDKTTFFHRPLGGKCVPEKSIWVPYGGADVKGIIVHLKKANPGEKWKRPLLSHSNAKPKATKVPPVRRESLPDDFGSPIGAKKSDSRWKRRFSTGMGQRSSSSRRLEPEEISGTPRAKGLGSKDPANIETPQHANGVNKASAHSLDLLLDVSTDEKSDDGSLFWGSTSSMPALGRFDDGDEDQGVEKKQRRRRLKKGSKTTQKFVQAAHAISPFSLKRKMRRSSVESGATDASDNNPSQEGTDENRRLGLRTALSGRIEAFTKGKESEEPMLSSYHQLDDGGDEESLSLDCESPEQMEPEKTESFSSMLAAAAPLPFDADDRPITTMGS